MKASDESRNCVSEIPFILSSCPFCSSRLSNRGHRHSDYGTYLLKIVSILFILSQTAWLPLYSWIGMALLLRNATFSGARSRSPSFPVPLPP